MSSVNESHTPLLCRQRSTWSTYDNVNIGEQAQDCCLVGWVVCGSLAAWLVCCLVVRWPTLWGIAYVSECGAVCAVVCVCEEQGKETVVGNWPEKALKYRK